MTLTAPSPDDYIASTWTDGVTNKLNDLNATYSRYTGTTTALTAGTWVALTWPTLTEGTGLGLSLASQTTFTLTKAGLWTVVFSGICGTIASHTGTIFGLATSTGFTTFLAEGQGNVLQSQVAGNLTAEINSDGTATVVVGAFAVGASPSISVAGGLPRVTFSCKDA